MSATLLGGVAGVALLGRELAPPDYGTQRRLFELYCRDFYAAGRSSRGGRSVPASRTQ